jgi:hypothetical protein
MIDHEDTIQDRACVLHDLLTELIDEGYGEVPHQYISTFKCVFALKTKSIKLFKSAFRDQGYEIDVEDVASTYFEFKDELPTGQELTEIERDIILELKEEIGRSRLYSL